METNKDLISKLKNLRDVMYNYVYPDCLNAHLYSKQYHNAILLKVFDDKEKQFSQIYGDVNKLSEVNRISKRTGDICLLRLFNDIKSRLPENSYFCRLGGDEISVILPDCTKEQASEIEESIHYILNRDRERLSGLTISLSSADSSQGNLQELEDLNEADVESQKHKRKDYKLKTDLHSEELLPLVLPKDSDSETAKKWTSLNNLIEKAIDNHLSDTRPSDARIYCLEDIKKEAFTLVSTVSDILNNKFTNSSKENNEDIDSSNIKQTDESPLNDAHTCSLISDILHLNNRNGSNFDWDSLSDEDLKKLDVAMPYLLDKILIKDDHHRLFNKSFLKYYLSNKLVKSNSDYQGIYLSISGIKPSNTAFGHINTDSRIEKTSKLLIDELSNACDFNNTSFKFNDSDNYLLDRGGGNYLALISSSNIINSSTIQSIVDSVNSKYDPQDENSPFKISFAYSYTMKKNTIEEFYNSITDLKNQCDKDKDILKAESISDITNRKAFANRISAAIDFYKENISTDENDIDNQRLFLSNLFTSLLNNEYYHNAYEGNSSLNTPMDLEI